MKTLLYWAALAASTTPASEAIDLPNIVVLGTGGTIAGSGATHSAVGYTSASVGVDDLVKELPELAHIANVQATQVMQQPSQNMNANDWLVIAHKLQSTLTDPKVDGVVITHGTDTLEETAYFLDLVIKSRKPIVVVGAMRPVTALSADGPFNLYNAVLVAGNKTAAGKGVLVLLNDQIHAARDVTKANTSMTDAFKAPEVGALGSIEGDHVYFYRAPLRRHTSATAFDITKIGRLPRVDIAYGYAGASRLVIDALVASGVDGIVYAGVGNGNFGTVVDSALQEARKKRIVVVRSSRVGSGNVVRNDEINDDQRDFIVSDNLNPQKARVLLMVALTQTRRSKELQAAFEAY